MRKRRRCDHQGRQLTLPGRQLLAKGGREAYGAWTAVDQDPAVRPADQHRLALADVQQDRGCGLKTPGDHLSARDRGWDGGCERKSQQAPAAAGSESGQRRRQP